MPVYGAPDISNAPVGAWQTDWSNVPGDYNWSYENVPNWDSGLAVSTPNPSYGPGQQGQAAASYSPISQSDFDQRYGAAAGSLNYKETTPATTLYGIPDPVMAGFPTATPTTYYEMGIGPPGKFDQQLISNPYALNTPVIAGMPPNMFEKQPTITTANVRTIPGVAPSYKAPTLGSTPKAKAATKAPMSLAPRTPDSSMTSKTGYAGVINAMTGLDFPTYSWDTMPPNAMAAAEAVAQLSSQLNTPFGEAIMDTITPQSVGLGSWLGDTATGGYSSGDLGSVLGAYGESPASDFSFNPDTGQIESGGYGGGGYDSGGYGGGGYDSGGGYYSGESGGQFDPGGFND